MISVALLTLALVLGYIDHSVSEPEMAWNVPRGRPRPKPCWIYTHMQKSGGSTIKDIMFKRWGKKFVTVYNTHYWKQGQAYTDDFVKDFMNGKWDIIFGSAVEGMRNSGEFTASCKWFTLFRHPIPRLVSAFFWCQNVPHDILCANEILRTAQRPIDILTFARHWGNYGLRQFVFGQIAADDVLTSFSRGELIVPNGIAWEKTQAWYLLKTYIDNHTVVDLSQEQISSPKLYDMLLPVQDLIRDRYAAVGILEEFNTTLALYDATLDMPGMNWWAMFQSLGVKNVNFRNMDQEREVLEKAWINSELKKYIQLDLLLYEHALDVFHEQTRVHGIS